MQGFSPESSFGPEAAGRYDDRPRGDGHAASEFLAARAHGARALEFAIGTGRIALPLSELGVEVDGIELSEAMVAQLRKKPGGADLDVWSGDMTAIRTGSSYGLIYVPSAWIKTNAYARPEDVAANAVVLDVCTYDPATQILDENHVRIGDDGVRFSPISCRLAWPSELDLMARIAGLSLLERYGGWHQQPYTGEGMHVSVYGRAPASSRARQTK
ncbi:methyltransferase domain-containing protein [Epidermidibacterium keratini]|uniref:Methyltransferase domain-containing protein n=1 Tax=Epidermidibacterium keratini TaxID=1891644 RepID=A0A7L4YU82_9ACTN|nr:class I SAM-dependent methyltransferase [Epidermidibacterium keratini]QHC02017.1 methyltransferase domain-containing protein [Epidermidibacterium keratini]